MTEPRQLSRSALGWPSPLRAMSSQVESTCVRFDDGSGVLARLPASVVEPQLAWKRS